MSSGFGFNFDPNTAIAKVDSTSSDASDAIASTAPSPQLAPGSTDAQTRDWILAYGFDKTGPAVVEAEDKKVTHVRASNGLVFVYTDKSYKEFICTKCGFLVYPPCTETSGMYCKPCAKTLNKSWGHDSRLQNMVFDYKDVFCPNRNEGCNERMRPKEVSEHLRVCGYERLGCIFEYFGCNFSDSRKNVLEHQKECGYKTDNGELLRKIKEQGATIEALDDQLDDVIEDMDQMEKDIAETKALMAKSTEQIAALNRRIEELARQNDSTKALMNRRIEELARQNESTKAKSPAEILGPVRFLLEYLAESVSVGNNVIDCLLHALGKDKVFGTLFDLAEMRRSNNCEIIKVSVTQNVGPRMALLLLSEVELLLHENTKIKEFGLTVQSQPQQYLEDFAPILARIITANKTLVSFRSNLGIAQGGEELIKKALFANKTLTILDVPFQNAELGTLIRQIVAFGERRVGPIHP